MPTSTQHTAATSAIKRRLIGGREWKVGLMDVLESERADLPNLKRLSDKYLTDSETQRLVALLYAEKAERMIKLNELLGYRDKDGDA